MGNGYRLNSDEAVVVHFDNARVNDDDFEFLLTNQNIVLTKTGIFGKIKSMLVYPLNQVKLVNDRPQVGIQRTDGHYFVVRTYFNNAEVAIVLDAKRKAETLSDLISGLVVGDPNAMVQQNVDLSMTQTEMLVDSVKENLGALISPFFKQKEESKTTSPQSKEKATTKCSGCGAVLSGFSGAVVVCEYCGTKNQI